MWPLSFQSYLLLCILIADVANLYDAAEIIAVLFPEIYDRFKYGLYIRCVYVCMCVFAYKYRMDRKVEQIDNLV